MTIQTISKQRTGGATKRKDQSGRRNDDGIGDVNFSSILTDSWRSGHTLNALRFHQLCNSCKGAREIIALETDGCISAVDGLLRHVRVQVCGH